MRWKQLVLMLCLCLVIQPIHSAHIAVSFQVTTKDHQPIQGARFQLMKDQMLYASDILSDAKGMVVLKDLESGSYSIMQTSTISGYEKDEVGQSFAYKEGDSLVLKPFINQKKVGMAYIQIVNENEEPQTHYAFTLWNESHDQSRHYQTDDKGYCVLKDLEVQTYEIEMDHHQVEFTITDENQQANYELKVYTKKKLPFAEKKQDASLWILTIAFLLMVMAIVIYFHKHHILLHLTSEVQEDDELDSL